MKHKNFLISFLILISIISIFKIKKDFDHKQISTNKLNQEMKKINEEINKLNQEIKTTESILLECLELVEENPNIEKYDSWNNKIQVVKINKDYEGFKVISLGKDGILNTNDDIIKEDLKYSYKNRIKKIFQ